jgi:hypothetical protein
MLWGKKIDKVSVHGEHADADERVGLGMGLQKSRQTLKGWSRRSIEVGHAPERREEEDVVM